MATPARIGYQSHTLDAGVTVSATSQQEDFEASNLLLPQTSEKWKPTSTGATVTIDLGKDVSANYIAIGAHTAGSTRKQVVVSYSLNGISYTTVSTTNPDNDNAIFVEFASAVFRYVRVFISGGTEIATIGVIYAGQYLQMYRPFYGGHSPITLSRKTDVRPNRTETGEWAGRSVVRQGLESEYRWQNTPIDWYIDNIESFSNAAVERPFFIQWSPEQFPLQATYAWTQDDIKPELQGVRDLCSFGFTARAIG